MNSHDPRYCPCQGCASLRAEMDLEMRKVANQVRVLALVEQALEDREKARRKARAN